MTDWLLPFFCGLGAAIVSAWGVGGGTLLLLAMTLFLDIPAPEARVINLLFFLPTAASALVLHAQSGNLEPAALRRTIPWAVPAALLGAWIALRLDTDLLRRPFGVYLLLSAASLLWPKVGRSPS